MRRMLYVCIFRLAVSFVGTASDSTFGFSEHLSWARNVNSGTNSTLFYFSSTNSNVILRLKEIKIT